MNVLEKYLCDHKGTIFTHTSYRLLKCNRIFAVVVVNRVSLLGLGPFPVPMLASLTVSSAIKKAQLLCVVSKNKTNFENTLRPFMLNPVNILIIASKRQLGTNNNYKKTQYLKNRINRHKYTRNAPTALHKQELNEKQV